MKIEIEIYLNYARKAIEALQDVACFLTAHGIQIEYLASNVFTVSIGEDDESGINIEDEVISILQSAGIPEDEYNISEVESEY